MTSLNQLSETTALFARFRCLSTDRFIDSGRKILSHTHTRMSLPAFSPWWHWIVLQQWSEDSWLELLRHHQRLPAGVVPPVFLWPLEWALPGLLSPWWRLLPWWTTSSAVKQSQQWFSTAIFKAYLHLHQESQQLAAFYLVWKTFASFDQLTSKGLHLIRPVNWLCQDRQQLRRVSEGCTHACLLIHLHMAYVSMSSYYTHKQIIIPSLGKCRKVLFSSLRRRSARHGSSPPETSKT